MERLRVENEELRVKIKSEKSGAWREVIKYKTKLSQTNEQLETEVKLRDKQLKDIQSSLMLLEGQLQEKVRHFLSATVLHFSLEHFWPGNF